MNPSFTPADLARFVRERGVDAAIIPMHMDIPTVPAAAEALGAQPAQIIKTLVFLVKDNPTIVIASGDTTVDRRPLADHYGTGKKQVKLADAETVLRVTGYAVGGVPPFGHVTQVTVLLDERIRTWDVVYGGGGDDRTLLRITPFELARVTYGEWIAIA